MKQPTVAEARAHRAALAAALEALDAPTPCQGEGRDAWTSEDPEHQALAIRACRPCPVLEVCRRAGRTEAFGVWGGFAFNRAPKALRDRAPAADPARWVEPVLIALATRPRPGPTGGLAKDAEALRPGEVLSGPALGHALRQLREAGHVCQHRKEGPVELTAHGQAAAEALTW